MRKSRNDKISAFADIYNEYKDDIFRVCYMYLRDYHLAEDAVQDTFFKVFLKLHTYRAKSSVKTWITKIAVNTCRDRLKKISKKEIKVVDLSLNPAETSVDIDSRLSVTQAVMALSAELREVIILYYYQDFTQKEIAELLHIPETTVVYRLKRAKEILRKDIKEDLLYD